MFGIQECQGLVNLTHFDILQVGASKAIACQYDRALHRDTAMCQDTSINGFEILTISKLIKQNNFSSVIRGARAGPSFNRYFLIKNVSRTLWTM